MLEGGQVHGVGQVIAHVEPHPMIELTHGTSCPLPRSR